MGRIGDVRGGQRMGPQLALLAGILLVLAACSSPEAIVAGDDGIAEPDVESPTTAAESDPVGNAVEDTADVEPDREPPEDGFVRVTVNLRPESIIDDVYGRDRTVFEVRSAIGHIDMDFGFLDQSGTIDIPAPLLGEMLRVEAELPDDEFCWWSGSSAVNSGRTDVTITVELEEICA